MMRPSSAYARPPSFSVVGGPASLDEPAILHPVDDPGRAGDRHVEGVGELSHGQRPGRLEDGQDVEVDEAQRALDPAAEDPDALLGAPGDELLDHVVEETRSPARLAIIQCHLENLDDIDHLVNQPARPLRRSRIADRLQAEPALRAQR